jgi:hypothetical protein
VERERRRRAGRRRSGSNIPAEEVVDLVRVLVEIGEAEEWAVLVHMDLVLAALRNGDHHLLGAAPLVGEMIFGLVIGLVELSI